MKKLHCVYLLQGRRTQLIHLICTQPGVLLLEHPLVSGIAPRGHEGGGCGVRGTMVSAIWGRQGGTRVESALNMPLTNAQTTMKTLVVVQRRAS